jgi:tetratricopeptide (TPR) repeat protein
MKTTANLWDTLCRDLEARRGARSDDEHHLAAMEFLQTARQLFPARSPRLCDAIEITGDVFQAVGKYPETVALYEEAHADATASNRVASIARLAAKLALLLDYLDQPTAASAYYEVAIENYGTLRDFPQVVILLNQLAGMQKRHGFLDAARDAYERALDIATRTHGAGHPEVATAANNLGVILSDMREFVRAENLHMQALALREKAYGALHPEVAQSLANLAVVFHAQKNYEKAAAYYESALQTYARFRAPNDPEYETVRANFDALQAKLH